MAVEPSTRKRASRSGNPKVRAAAQPPPPDVGPQQATSADSWVSKEGRGNAEIITLPSGNKALVRRSGPEAFLEQGLIPDRLTPIVEEAIHKKKGLKPKQAEDIMNDPKTLGSLVEMLDRTLVYAVVDPIVVMPPVCVRCEDLDILASVQHKDQSRDDFHDFVEGERKPGVLYADRVDFDDKMFVMNFCLGGTRDLEKFRRETGASLAGVLGQQVVSGQAE